MWHIHTNMHAGKIPIHIQFKKLENIFVMIPFYFLCALAFYLQLWAAMLVFRIEPASSGRTASVNLWAISPASNASYHNGESWCKTWKAGSKWGLNSREVGALGSQLSASSPHHGARPQAFGSFLHLWRYCCSTEDIVSLSVNTNKNKT